MLPGGETQGEALVDVDAFDPNRPVEFRTRPARAAQAVGRITRTIADTVPGSTTAALLGDGTLMGGRLPTWVFARAAEADCGGCTTLRDGNAAVWVVPFDAQGGRLVTRVMPAREPTDAEISLVRAVAETVAVVLESLEDVSARPASPDPLALHDALTHLPDARLFDLRLAEEIASAARNGQMLAIVTVDLDGLRHINDRRGRGAGDRALRQAASRLHHAVRRSDVLARVGEDEFSLICHIAGDRPESAHLPLQLVETLAKPLMLDGAEIKLSGSVGLALYPIDGVDAGVLRRNSVTALHRAKLRGASQFEYFTPRMNDEAMARLSIETALRKATDAGAFELHYQPIVGADRRVRSLEALIRWPHPEKEMVSPADFIPVAEQTGLIVPIGRWVLNEATRQAAEWCRQGRAVRVACNVSPVQFLRPDFVSTVTAALAKSGLPVSLLEIELTEGVLMNETADAIDKLHQIRRLGVTIAVDDFGTGYSSLSRLHQLPIDRLKIDRSFVSAVASADDQSSLRHRTAVVRSVVALARNLDLSLVAEGVETERQFRFLKHMGYDAMQGYLFSKPVPAAVVPGLLDRLGLATQQATRVRNVA